MKWKWNGLFTKAKRKRSIDCFTCTDQYDCVIYRNYRIREHIPHSDSYGFVLQRDQVCIAFQPNEYS